MDIKRRISRFYRFLKVLTPAERLKVLFGTIVVILICWFVAGYLRHVLQWSKEDRRDAQHSANVNAALKQADTHEQAADNLAVERQIHESKAADARARKERARTRSESSAKELDDAIKRQTDLRSTPVNSATPIADSDICSELAKRNIDCR